MRLVNLSSISIYAEFRPAASARRLLLRFLLRLARCRAEHFAADDAPRC